MYTLTDFNKNYIDISFDNILDEINNPHINSNVFYLDHKNKYLDKTRSNYLKLEKLLHLYNSLKPNHIIKNADNIMFTRHTYTYIDKEYTHTINIDIKNIFIDQQKLYDTFINYIDFINKSHTDMKNQVLDNQSFNSLQTDRKAPK